MQLLSAAFVSSLLERFYENKYPFCLLVLILTTGNVGICRLLVSFPHVVLRYFSSNSIAAEVFVINAAAKSRLHLNRFQFPVCGKQNLDQQVEV